MMRVNQNQHEASNGSQNDKINNDHFPHSVMITGSDVSQDLNTPSNYPTKFSILDVNNIHNKMK
jgi:hypothetical protein